MRISRSRSSAASSGASGGLYRRPALSSSSSNSGKRAICSAIHGLAAQSSSKRCSARIFSQQDQVGRTPGDRFHQRQYAFEHQIRIVLLDGLRQQPWNEGIQTLAAETLHGAYLAGVAQRGEPLTGALAITETGLGQLAAGELLVPVLLPQRQPFAADQRLALGILVLIRVGDDLAEMPVDAPAPVQQLLAEGRPTVEASMNATRAQSTSLSGSICV